MFKIEVIASSSSGNCYLLKTEKESLILECGIPYKKIILALGYDLGNVVGCTVSHEHGDHAQACNEMIKAGIDLYASTGTFQALNINSHRTHAVKAGQEFKAGGFRVLPFTAQHDAADPLGFLIQHSEVGKLVFITDSYYCKYQFSEINYLMIECNYSKEIAFKNLAEGKIDKFQINRLLKSHFSLERVKDFLKANDLSSLKEILLMHLSNRNSDAEFFKTEIQKQTGCPVRVC